MRHAPLHLILCTNGAYQGQAALDYGVWLAQHLSADVSLLGIIEPGRSRSGLEATVADVEGRVREAGAQLEIHYLKGSAVQALSTWRGPTGSILVVGPFGRPPWLRWVRGRSIRRLMGATPHPLLFVGQPKQSLERMLVCLGGLEVGLPAEELALNLARRASARVTILHVLEPIGYDYPIARELQNHADALLESDTPQARLLTEAMAAARQVDSEAELVVGHGSVVTEILAETKRRAYDLISVGSVASARALRHLYTPNVAAEIAELGGMPVLIGGEPSSRGPQM
jgi:nucleotide-binding universal stress UspA family protein